jgi:hypothetical protein
MLVLITDVLQCDAFFDDRERFIGKIADLQPGAYYDSGTWDNGLKREGKAGGWIKIISPIDRHGIRHTGDYHRESGEYCFNTITYVRYDKDPDED